MNVASIPIQHNGFFIFDSISLMRYSKKNFKGRIVAYLKPFKKNNRVIDYRYLKKLELMSLDFLFNNEDKMLPSLKVLRHVKDAKKLALHHLIKEDRDLYLTYKILKRCKSLSSLELNTINRSEKITDKGLFWLKKILRLTKKVQSLSYCGLRQNMSDNAICRTFSQLPKLEFLKKINLELCLNWKFIPALNLICSLLALCRSLRFVSLNIKYYDTVYDGTFLYLFAPLMKIEYLKEVSIYLGVYDYKIADPIAAIEPMSTFLEKSSYLEVFSLDMRLEKYIPFCFPFEKANNLRKLSLHLKESKGLVADNFKAFAESIKQCKKLTDFTLNISKCANLHDDSIQDLCEALASLTDLKTLVLLVGDKISPTNNLSTRSVQHISEALYKMKSLLDLELNFSNFKTISDDHVDSLDQELEFLFQAIADNTKLKELKLDLSYSTLTDKAFQSLSKNLKRLSSLETLEFDLYYCDSISTEFLNYLSTMLLNGEPNFKNLHKVMMNLTGSLVSKEQATAYHSILKRSYPKCYMSLYIR